MSIKDKINSLIGNFEDETIVDEENSNNQESASSLASDPLALKKRDYEEAKEEFLSKVKEIRDLHSDREKKIKKNINYLKSEKEKLEKELSQYRADLVESELQGKSSKTDNLNKKISSAKDEIAELEERIDSYKAAGSIQIKPEQRKELLELYQVVDKKRITYRKAGRKRQEQLKELKKQLEKEIEKVRHIFDRPGSLDVINKLSIIEHLIHEHGRVEMLNHERESMYKDWLEGDKSYKKYLEGYVHKKE